MTHSASRGSYAIVLAYLSLALVMLFFAGNSIVARAIRDETPPFTLALVRWLGALIVVAPFAIPHLIADRSTLGRNIVPLVVLGLLGTAVFNAFLYNGLAHTTATNSLLLQAAIPAFVLVFSRLFFAERASLMQQIGVSVSALGVIFIVVRADLRVLSNLTFGFGDILVLCGVVSWSLYTALLRWRPKLHPLSFVAVSFFVGAICMAPPAAMEWAQGARPSLSPQVLGAFAYVAIFPTVIAYLLFNAAVSQIGPAKAGKGPELEQLIASMVQACRAEPGNVRFDVWQDRHDPHSRGHRAGRSRRRA
jgi:drug/metabolite transporter (DMT)-like permease